MPKKLIAAALALFLATSVGIPVDAMAAQRNCSAKVQTSNKWLGKFYGAVQDTASGKVLLSVRSTEQTPSASVLKLFTAAAALSYVPQSYQAQTRVFRSISDPSVLYLVGGGDHTLSAFNQPSYTTYKNPAKLSALAYSTLKRLGQGTTVSKIITDSTFFDETGFNLFWKPSDRTNGYVPLISPLMADADRQNADLTSKLYNSVRSTNPSQRAGELFKTALGAQASAATVQSGTLADDAELLATVKSQPLAVWIEHAMHVSDNTETEFIARHVEKYLGRPTTFAAILPMIRKTLTDLNLGHKGLVMKDASGLSQFDRVTPILVSSLLRESVNPNSSIADLPSLLPSPTTYGTLTARFKGKNSVVRDYVVAKSGFIPGVSSLAGLLQARDGSTLSFAFFARTDVKQGFKIGYFTKDAIDTLVAKAYLCGTDLTN
jgi:D-alanyl-D-alanine carboxypeptidase/D-alanyl-D-alanine-endopeptidase (penicillin-binding protein 4)